MIAVEQLQDKVTKVNGSRRTRTLHQRDVEKFVELVNNATPDQRTIRVYSSDGFVANSYKYRADISYLQADRDAETGNFIISAGVADAKRSHGNGSTITVNGRAA